MNAPHLSGVKALTFDVFGTVVDWRASIIREGQLLGLAHGLAVDWPAFADAWRAGYRPAMDRVNRGEAPWANIDTIHRQILDGLLERFGLAALPPEAIEHFNRVWHRLMPWPDAVPGLNRLRSRFVLSTLSNGNVALLVNMARNAGLPWDCTLCAELIGRYKPDLEVYRTAARLLGRGAHEVMMVAAHPDDLRAAKAAGLMTAYVPRPLEHGPAGRLAPASPGEFDIVAGDFLELAQRLG